MKRKAGRPVTADNEAVLTAVWELVTREVYLGSGRTSTGRPNYLKACKNLIGGSRKQRKLRFVQDEEIFYQIHDSETLRQSFLRANRYRRLKDKFPYLHQRTEIMEKYFQSRLEILKALDTQIRLSSKKPDGRISTQIY